jgi:coniferyl-aldehyde dehydrogenase
MSTLDERADTITEDERAALGAILDRQRQAFVDDGPPSVAVRRNRIDRLMALVLDNTDAFVDAMAADFGTQSKAATLFTEVIGMISVIEHTRSHVAQTNTHFRSLSLSKSRSYPCLDDHPFTACSRAHR